MRVTGGRLRSRTLVAPRGQGTRPTTDRVREALFGILASAGRLPGARVLDLYAGTGALAIEALSRGAAHATLVESSRDALAAARANVAALGLADAARIVAVAIAPGPAAQRVARAGPFDLVLADPPWPLVDAGEAGRVLADLVGEGALSEPREPGDESPLVVLEHSTRTAPEHLLIRGLLAVQTRRYGDSTLTFYKPAILPPQRPGEPGSLPE
jgi:16S rRNA (guanine966-N2)-methyltransferase